MRWACVSAVSSWVLSETSCSCIPRVHHRHCRLLVWLTCSAACAGAGAKQSYAEQESLVNQQLAQLIRDAVWLKSYLAAVMRLSQEAFQLSHAALGPPQGPAQVCPSPHKRSQNPAAVHTTWDAL